MRRGKNGGICEDSVTKCVTPRGLGKFVELAIMTSMKQCRHFGRTFYGLPWFAADMKVACPGFSLEDSSVNFAHSVHLGAPLHTVEKGFVDSRIIYQVGSPSIVLLFFSPFLIFKCGVLSAFQSGEAGWSTQVARLKRDRQYRRAPFCRFHPGCPFMKHLRQERGVYRDAYFFPTQLCVHKCECYMCQGSYPSRSLDRL